MNIIVCVKHVPDTAAKVEMDSESKSIDRTDLAHVLNPYDEYAVEEALKLKEKSGGEVVLITMGPKRADEALRTGLAMGADKGVHICDDRLAGSDALVTARVLSAAIKTMTYDIILCGKLSVDANNCQVGQMVAELLDIPHVSIITKLEVQDGKAVAHREVEGGKEVIETQLPALFTAEKDLNKPRYPSLPGIMKAKQKEVKLLDMDAIQVDQKVGTEGSLEKLVDVSLPPKREAGRIIEGEPGEAVNKLVSALRDEAKVI
ncbi:MAG: electron transfer flavoprotein subunit beta/FixA family protein [Thermoplasmata archaeon]|nr:electron transfer flavoprotein subunit beta/FixA family protein [Thermoplasmata archaeon]